MSYNVDGSDVIDGRGLTLTGRQILLFKTLDLPEDHMLVDFDEDDLDPDKDYPIDVNWRGEGSGYTYGPVLVAKILPATKGSADIIYTWEGGDSFTGLRVVDGHVTKHAVVRSLGEVVK